MLADAFEGSRKEEICIFKLIAVQSVSKAVKICLGDL
jgi:hypothetical protein